MLAVGSHFKTASSTSECAVADMAPSRALICVSAALVLLATSSAVFTQAPTSKVLGVTSAARRPFPDTSRRIAIFADQLPGDMTAAQRQFAATHYAGSQKLTLDQST